MLAHMSNGYVGYIPTPAAIRRGGFEAEACHWSKLEAPALDTIAAAALDLARDLNNRENRD
jgi:hypothetical protein